jgi:MFS transporter, MHS family, shikimate and dehydroshikimate transport protein
VVATSLLATFGTLNAVGAYLAALGLLAAICAFPMRSSYQPSHLRMPEAVPGGQN